MRPRPPRLSRGLAVAAAITLVSGVGIAVATQASAASGCRVNYSVNQWNTGFTANINLTNLGDPITNGWTLTWDFAGTQKITQGWSGTFTQSGQHVSVANPSWATSLATNSTYSLGFNADYTGTNAAPASFSLNGVACTGAPTGGTTTAPTTSPTTPTTPTVTTPPATPPATGAAGPHADNPYVGGKGYINPEWKAKAEAEPGGSRVSSNPTGVWLDRHGDAPLLRSRG